MHIFDIFQVFGCVVCSFIRSLEVISYSHCLLTNEPHQAEYTKSALQFEKTLLKEHHTLRQSYLEVAKVTGTGLSALAKVGLQTNVKIMLLLIRSHSGSKDSDIIPQVLGIVKDVVGE